ncbi:hypothetical protein PHYBOEH_010790 [Phytophthora boehmeriae]|uniref:GAF domain-containing protein n=1 Tax=Phytophthora boehmeriae TaxID=109152 RepID=A0A8T1WYG4_9STRA|nr:hypothetical protein PHYBOEH_010790 [Phytophthora boehmeriae]
MHRREDSGDGSQRRYVRASDRRLAEVVAQASKRIDWDDLHRRHAKVSDVTTEALLDGTLVTATCIIECSIAEISALINPPTSQHYACAMRELIGRDFIYGAIVHHAKEITTQEVTVKTVTLMKRHLLARSEQWCYVSSVKALDPSGSLTQGYSITIASLHPDDVFIGKAQASSVIHLQGLSSVYLVTPEHRTVEDMKKSKKAKRAIRMTYYAHVAKTCGGSKPSRLRWLLSSIRGRDEVDEASNGVVVSRAAQQAYMLQQYGSVVRRRRIDAQVLANLREVQPKLELLCNVARGELKCDATLVTIIGPDASFVVASTDAAWRGCSIPRDHSICAHTLMSRKPLLVPHPEADVRFSAMNLVRRDGVRFYFGFPILISYPEGGTTAVGTFCCVHAGQSRDVSESQYALMTTLAEGATRVMESHASLLQS